jgi:hypothetical protein
MPEVGTLVDQLLPRFDVSDSVAVEVEAPVDDAWDALMATDLVALGRRRPVVGLLGGIRALPELLTHWLTGRRAPHVPGHLTLRGTAESDVASGGWLLLAEERHALALGLVGRFWRPVIPYASIAPDDFASFAEPGWAKTVYLLRARAVDDQRTQLVATMRTATTSEHARRWFDRYWTLGVGAGAHLLARSLLEDAAATATVSRRT